jgi:hypothetical protein
MSDDDIAYYRDILNNRDAFYEAKYQHGEVRPGWSFALWTMDRVKDIKPFGSRGCRTALVH